MNAKKPKLGRPKKAKTKTLKRVFITIDQEALKALEKDSILNKRSISASASFYFEKGFKESGK